MSVVKLLDAISNEMTGLGGLSDKSTYNLITDTYLHHNYTSCDAKYATWLGAAAIDSIPDDITKNGITIKSDDVDPQEAIEAIYESNALEKLNETLKNARVYGGAGLFLNVGSEYDSELTLESIQLGELINLVVLDRYELTPEIDSDILSPTFEKPIAYRKQGLSSGIHHSRVLKFDGIKPSKRAVTQTNGWGRSVFDRIYQAIETYIQAEALVKAISSDGGTSVVKLDGISNNNYTADEQLTMITAIMRAKSAMRAMVIGKDDDYQYTPMTLGDLPAVLQRQIEVISAATHIPQNRLMGSAPEGLSTDGDSQFRNYYDYVSSQQQSINDQVDWLLRVVLASKYGRPVDFTWEWAPLWEMSQVETADLRLKAVQEVVTLVQSGLFTVEMAVKHLRDKGYYDIPEEYIQALGAMDDIGDDADAI